MIKDIFGIKESLIISTCNRTEIYYSAEEEFGDKLVKLLLEKSNVFAGELYTDTLPPKLDAIINAVQAIGPTDRIIVTQRVLHGIIDGKYDVDKEEAVS